MKQCGSCNLCCKVIEAPSINKAAGEWCPYAKLGPGCFVYRNLPHECKAFSCMWLEVDALGPHWKPDKARFVLHNEPDRGLVVHVDSTAPNAWRKSPYYETIKAWSKMVESGKGQVIVVAGNVAHAIFPTDDVFIGVVEREDKVKLDYKLEGKTRRPRAVVVTPAGLVTEYAGKAVAA